MLGKGAYGTVGTLAEPKVPVYGDVLLLGKCQTSMYIYI